MTILVPTLAAYLYGKTIYETAGLLILSVISAGGLYFVMEDSHRCEDYLYGNERNLWYFTALYVIFLIGSVVFPLLPRYGWPYLAIYTGLMLFSGKITALYAGSILLLFSSLLADYGSTLDFCLYFMIGFAGILLFAGLDEQFQAVKPLVCSCLLSLLLLVMGNVLLVNETLQISQFTIPLINTLVSLILLLVLLKLFGFSIIYKTRDVYMDINDPEYPLLVQLKEFSKEEYFHAVHTSYLCGRIAMQLGLNEAVARAGGYYHKIGLLKGENTLVHAEEVLKEYPIPDEVYTVIREYLSSDAPIKQKETVVLLFADTVISSITYLFSKNSSANLNYKEIVETICKRKLDSGMIDESDLTFAELQQMKNVLLGEQLYYDFLR